MKLVMTLLVRDEVDIVDDNLKFHLANGVDHVVATDNGSIDGTVEILEEYARTGVLTLIHEPSQDYLQSAWMTRMALRARDEIGADWIFCNDADEFWLPQTGSLKDVIAASPASLLTCRRVNMIAPYVDLPNSRWQDTLIWRARFQTPPPRLENFYEDRMIRPFFFYQLPNKILFRAEGLIEVLAGAHNARFRCPVNKSSSEILIYHFPVRDLGKFAANIRNKGEASERNTNLKQRDNWKSRRWWRMIEHDGSAERVFAEALPSRSRFLKDKLSFRLVRDETIRRELKKLSD